MIKLACIIRKIVVTRVDLRGLPALPWSCRLYSSRVPSIRV